MFRPLLRTANSTANSTAHAKKETQCASLIPTSTASIDETRVDNSHARTQLKRIEKSQDGKAVTAHLMSGKRVHGDAMLYAMGRLGNTDSLNLQVRLDHFTSGGVT